MHQHVAGCSFDFNSLSTAQKWYALHALLLDEAEQPHWSKSTKVSFSYG